RTPEVCHNRRCVMPVLTLECPECGHRFQGLVLVGTRPPEEWVCSKCGSRKAEVVLDKEPVPHPWEGVHGIDLRLCCNGGYFMRSKVSVSIITGCGSCI